jgi:Arc/MetJ family transcription regulator
MVIAARHAPDGEPGNGSGHACPSQEPRTMVIVLVMYTIALEYVRMKRRTTIEIDPQLLEGARRALGTRTIRSTVEEALRRASAGADQERGERSARQRRYLRELPARIDPMVLASDEMWR